MDLLFQVNLAHGKISDVDPSATTHAEVLAQYSAQVERENSLEEGTLKHAITAAVPFSRRERKSPFFSHGVGGTADTSVQPTLVLPPSRLPPQTCS